MNQIEQEILSTLNNLDQTVKTMRSAKPPPNIQPLLARLDELTRQLPKDSDPDLLHYMHKKSYEKARLLLGGRNSENQRGGCGTEGFHSPPMD